jgi:hypothetical protein
MRAELDIVSGTIHFLGPFAGIHLHSYAKGFLSNVKCQETPQGKDQQAQTEKTKTPEPSQKKDMAGVKPPHRYDNIRGRRHRDHVP